MKVAAFGEWCRTNLGEWAIRDGVVFFYVGARRIIAASYVPRWSETFKPDDVETIGQHAGPAAHGDLNRKLSHLNRPRGEKRTGPVTGEVRDPIRCGLTDAMDRGGDELGAPSFCGGDAKNVE